MGLLNKEKYAPIRPNRIGSQLPYFEFDSDESSPFWRCHLLKDGTLGMCWKTKVPPSYSTDNGINRTNTEFLSFIESLPTGYQAQVIITTHNDLSDRMEEYLSLDTHNDKARALRQSRAEKLLEAGFRGYKVSEDGYMMLRDSYMIITLKSTAFGEELGAVKQLINLVYQTLGTMLSSTGIDVSRLTFFDNFFNSQVRSGMTEFKETLMSVESTLNDMFGLSRARRMSLTDLKKHYWTAYAPSAQEPGQEISVDPEIPFADQCFPVPIEHDWDIVKIGNDYHGLITLAMMPDVVAADYLSQIRRSILTQHTCFMNIVHPSQGVEKVKLSLSSEFRKRVQGAFSKEESEAFAEEVSQVRHRMFSGRKIMYVLFGMLIHGYSRKYVEDQLLRIGSTFKRLSCVPDIEKTMALQGLSYSWPFVYDHQFSTPYARTRRVMSDDLTDLIPIHGHWGGSKVPQAVYVNRDGEITFFDHTSPSFVNWHYAITGTSGSGKSFAVTDLVLQLYAAGVERQFLITIKDDYDRFAETMGRAIVVDLDSPTSCINPFAGIITKQRLQQWVVTAELMIKKDNPDDLDPELSRLLEEVLQYAYEMVPQGDVLKPTWIKEALYKYPYGSEKQRELGLYAASELGSFCHDGMYGKLFDGKPAISEKDSLVVFNLQNVVNEKISNVIINAIFTMIDNVMYMGDRAARKHLLVDEMISLVSSKGGAEVGNQIKRAFRTYRSLNCMCGIASQNEEDLTTDVGQAIIGNITKRLMLKPKKEMIPMLMQTLSLRGERHEANLNSLDTKPGYYSEFYLMSPSGEVVCRLLSDKLTFALATTQPDDTAEILRLKDEFDGDWWQATVAFAQRFPNGVRAARAAALEAEQRQKRQSER